MSPLHKFVKFMQFSFHIVLALTMVHFGYVTYKENTHHGHWQRQAEVRQEKLKEKQQEATQTRAPSSQSLMDYSPKGLDIFKEYFQYNNFDKYVSYDLGINFRTTKDEDYISDKAKKALQNTIIKTLSPIDVEDDSQSVTEKSVTTLVKENLIQEVMANFIKTLKVYKIVNGTFQIDLNFSPKLNTEFSYREELASNDLLNWGEKGHLPLDLESTNDSLPYKVYKTAMPTTEEPYQYVGGQISIWIKVLDMVPRLKIPTPKKNAVKGFVRFRKYFQANALSEKINFSKDNDLIISSNQMNRKNNETKDYVTVDIFKTFNLATLSPQLEKVEFHFGKLLPDNLYKNSFVGRLFSKKEKAIETGELELEGKVKVRGYFHPFKTTIETLTFDFEKGDFSTKSKFSTNIKSSSITPSQKGMIKNKIERMILERHALELISNLKLGKLQDFTAGN